MKDFCPQIHKSVHAIAANVRGLPQAVKSNDISGRAALLI